MIRAARKRNRMWVAVVLPGLLLRALIPVGFMPMFGPGMSVQLALCADYAPIAPPTSPESMDMPGDMPVDMPMGAAATAQQVPHPEADPSTGGGNPHSHPDHGVCPYAATSTLAAHSILIHVSTPVEPAAPPHLWLSQVTYSSTVSRAQSARGPPSEV